MSIRRLVGLASSLVVLSLVSVYPLAQAPKPAAEQPQLALISFTKVRPAMGPKFVDLQTKEVMPAQKKGGSPGRQAFSSGIAGAPGEFVFVTPITNMAMFDEQPPMRKALGDEGAAALNQKLAEVSEPMGSLVARMRPDLSYVPDPKAPPSPLGVITIVELVPGKRAGFETFLKTDVVPAMQKAKVRGYHVMEIVFGENTGGYITVVGMESYAEIGKGHPFEIALGEGGSQKMEVKAAGLITKIHRFISRHRPELSWSPSTS
jgi:hypothetical protein